jgi:hypothetical protein
MTPSGREDYVEISISAGKARIMQQSILRRHFAVILYQNQLVASWRIFDLSKLRLKS